MKMMIQNLLEKHDYILKWYRTHGVETVVMVPLSSVLEEINEEATFHFNEHEKKYYGDIDIANCYQATLEGLKQIEPIKTQTVVLKGHSELCSPTFIYRKKVNRNELVTSAISNDGKFAFCLQNKKEAIYVNCSNQVLKVKDEHEPLLIEFVLNHDPFVRNQILLNKRNGFGYLHVNLDKIFIVLPLQDDQKKLVNFLSLIDKKIEAYEEELKQLEQLKKYLLQNLFI